MKEVWRRRKIILYAGGKTENTKHAYFPFSLPLHKFSFTTPLPLCAEEVFPIRKHQIQWRITFSPSPSPSAIRVKEQTRGSEQQSSGGHQQLTDPPRASWQFWGPHSISPFCLWHSYHCTYWQTLMLINKMPQNIQLKILAGYLLPASLHEDEMSDGSLPEPETSLCRLCPELQGKQASFQVLLFRKTRRNRDRWRREGKTVIWYPFMQLYEDKLLVFISDGNTLQSKPFCEPPKLFMKRTYVHHFFTFLFPSPPPSFILI